MLQWTEPVQGQYQLVELFSGKGHVSEAFRANGKRVVSFDREVGGAAMDILETAGFLLGPHTYIVLVLLQH